MRKIFVISTIMLASVAILLNAVQQGVFQVWFYANQDQIEARYCVNISQPELDCHARCYLSEKISEMDQSTHQDGVVQAMDGAKLTQYIHVCKGDTELIFAYHAGRLPAIYFDQYSYLPVKTLFRPPA